MDDITLDALKLIYYILTAMQNGTNNKKYIMDLIGELAEITEDKAERLRSGK